MSESAVDDQELTDLPPKLRAYAAASARCDQGLFDLLQASARMHEATRKRILKLEMQIETTKPRSWLGRLLFGGG